MNVLTIIHRKIQQVLKPAKKKALFAKSSIKSSTNCPSYLKMSYSSKFDRKLFEIKKIFKKGSLSIVI